MNDNSIKTGIVKFRHLQKERYSLIKKILEGISILLFISPGIFLAIFIVMNAFVFGTFFGVLGFATLFPAWLAIGLVASLIISLLAGFFLYANDWEGVFKAMGKWILWLIYTPIVILVSAGGAFLMGVAIVVIPSSLAWGLFALVPGLILSVTGIILLFAGAFSIARMFMSLYNGIHDYDDSAYVSEGEWFSFFFRSSESSLLDKVADFLSELGYKKEIKLRVIARYPKYRTY